MSCEKRQVEPCLQPAAVWKYMHGCAAGPFLLSRLDGGGASERMPPPGALRFMGMLRPMACGGCW